MRIRLRTVSLIAVPLMLLAAACGSNPTSGSSRTGSGGGGSPATSPATSQVALSETGATELYPLLNEWAPAYNAKYPNVTITTGDTGSGAGISQAVAGAVNIGASGAYLSDGDMAAHQGLMNIALTIDAQQVNYNLPGVTEHLKLNGKVLAAMYRGTIKTWNDPQITALNPGVNLPATPVVPLHRSDGSGDTFLFTQYLSKQDPDGWGKSPGFGTTVDFPAVPGALGENGNGGMVTGCAADAGLRRLHRHQLPRPGQPEGAGRSPAGQCLGQVPAARRPKHSGRGRRLRLADPGERGDLADQRSGRGRVPDRQLRVRHRHSKPEGCRHRADDAGVPALGGHRRQQPLVPGPGSLPAAAGRGGEVVRRPDRQDLQLSDFGDPY